MAEAGTPDDKINPVDDKINPVDLASLQDKITCQVCKKPYTCPKTLNCLHSYCISCLRSLSTTNSKGGTHVQCPKCSKKTPIPESDFEALPEAFHIKRDIQLNEFLQKVNGNIVAKCEKCAGKSAKATSYCSECMQFICDLCVTIHRCWSDFQSHKVVSLEKFRISNTVDIPEQFQLLTCTLHSKKCTIYCETCKKEICHECIVGTHHGHMYNLAQDSAVDHKKALKSSMTVIEDIPQQLKVALEEINSILGTFSAEGEAVISETKAKFEELQKQISLRCEELVKGAQELMEDKQKPLVTQRDELETMKEKATECLEFVSRATSSNHIVEFFSLETQMVAQIQSIKKEFEGIELNPKEKPEIHFFQLSNLAEMIATESSIGDGSILYAGASEGKYFSVNEIITFFIALSSAYYKSKTNPIKQLKAEIQSVRDGSACPAKIVVSSSGFAKLQCSFSERGRYRVIVQVNGKHITGSPYAFYVMPPPQQFQAPVKSITNLSGPRGVAINSKNHIVVSEENSHRIVVYGRKSKIVLTFGRYGSEVSQFKHPLGVAVDKDECIYVADSKNNRLLKFSADGNFLAEFIGEKSTCGILSNPSSVKISNNNIYIVDRGNARVLVLNCDLEYQYEFGGHGAGLGKLEDPWDVAFDGHGIVYVTDMKIHSIVLFNARGEFRGRIGSHGTQKGTLNCPTGIAIDRFNRIFVSESGNHRVSIFHACSEFLECFSTGLAMINPCGITVDNDGFVYITSSESVLVF